MDNNLQHEWKNYVENLEKREIKAELMKIQIKAETKVDLETVLYLKVDHQKKQELNQVMKFNIIPGGPSIGVPVNEQT